MPDFVKETELCATLKPHYALETILVFLFDVLFRHYNEQKNLIYKVDKNFSDDLIFLPDVDDWMIAIPGRDALAQRAQKVSGYIVPTDSSLRGSDYASIVNFDNGHLVTKSFVAGIIFRQGVMPRVLKVPGSRQSNARRIKQEEYEDFRAMRYLGALRHTIQKFGQYEPYTLKIVPVTDLSFFGLDPVYDDGQTEPQGKAVFGFDVVYMETDPKSVSPDLEF